MARSETRWSESARWEYRVFAADLEEEAEALLRVARSRSAKRSDDTYLVTRSASDVSVKMRDSRIEAKQLLARQNGVELWCPILKNARQISVGFLLTELVLPPVTDLRVSPDDLLQIGEIADFVDRTPGLQTVSVQKQRLKFAHDKALSEFVYVETCGRIVQSVAVESQDVGAVERLLGQMDLAARPNESYAAFLRRIVFP